MTEVIAFLVHGALLFGMTQITK